MRIIPYISLIKRHEKGWIAVESSPPQKVPIISGYTKSEVSHHLRFNYDSHLAFTNPYRIWAANI